jgi:hypothetical protein
MPIPILIEQWQINYYVADTHDIFLTHTHDYFVSQMSLNT